MDVVTIPHALTNSPSAPSSPMSTANGDTVCDGSEPATKRQKLDHDGDSVMLLDGACPEDKPSAKATLPLVTRTAEELLQELESKTLEKEAKAAELAKKKAEREAQRAARASVKAAKDSVKAAKDSVKAAKQQEVRQMGNFLTGWIKKRSVSPEPSHSPASSVIATENGNLRTPTSKLSRLDKDPSSSPEIVVVAPSVFADKGKRRNQISDFDKSFRPFNVKATVRLAPVNRFFRPRRATPLHQLDSNPHLSRPDSVQDYIARVPECRRPCGPTRISPSVQVKDVIRKIAEAEISGSVDAVKDCRKILGDTSKVRIKTLVFYEDARPGYVGTWSKSTNSIRPRRPFGRETGLLNYDYDSEADFVDDPEEDGEDLGNDEGISSDEDGQEKDEDDLDGWLVGDDDVEVGEDMEVDDDLIFMGGSGIPKSSSEDVAARQKRESDKCRKAIKEREGAAKRRRLVGPLIPVIRGTLWEETLGKVESTTLEPFRLIFINDASVGLDPFSFTPTPIDVLLGLTAQPDSAKGVDGLGSGTIDQLATSSLSQANPATDACITNNDTTSLVVTTSTKSRKLRTSNQQLCLEPKLMEAFIKIVDGAQKSKPLLIEDVRVAFEQLDYKASRAMIERELNACAKKAGKAWTVKAEVKRLP